MFALTLKHPWPYAFLHLGKDVENRTWKPAGRLRGCRVVLHGGAYPRGAAWREAEEDLAWMQDMGLAPAELELEAAIVEGLFAVGRYARAVCESGEPPDPIHESPWFNGPWGWVIEDLRPLPEPIPCKGALSLWTVTGGAAEKLRRQLGEVGV